MPATAKKDQDAAMWTCKTHSQVAKFFDVSRQCIKGWGAEGMPGKTGRYDLSEIFKWRSKRAKASRREQDEGFTFWHSEKEKELTLKYRTERALRDGALWDSATSRQNLAMILSTVKNEMESLPDDLQMLWPEESRVQTKADMENRVRLLLIRMSESELYEGVSVADVVCGFADFIRSGKTDEAEKQK